MTSAPYTVLSDHVKGFNDFKVPITWKPREPKFKHLQLPTSGKTSSLTLYDQHACFLVGLIQDHLTVKLSWRHVKIHSVLGLKENLSKPDRFVWIRFDSLMLSVDGWMNGRMDGWMGKITNKGQTQRLNGWILDTIRYHELPGEPNNTAAVTEHVINPT